MELYKTMKKILLFFALFLPFIASAQLTTINPDTVCYQTSGSIYQVTNQPGTTYNWTVLGPGILISGQGTNTINVDWSSAPPGLIPNAVSVFGTNSSGCQSPPVVLDVFILNIVPIITQLGPYCLGEPCVTLTATPAGGTWSGNGVVGDQFCSNTAGVGTSNITYSITEAGCVFSTTSTITVLPFATISPISHN